MSRMGIAIAIAAAALAGALYLALHSDSPAITGLQDGKPGSQAIHSPPQLSTKPIAKSPPPSVQSTSSWSLADRLRDSKDHLEFFNSAAAAGTGEGYYFASKVAARCVAVQGKPYLQMREEFIASRLNGNRTQSKRLESFDRVWGPCAPFEKIGKPLEGERVAMLAKAAERSEPRAVAELAVQLNTNGRRDEATQMAADLAMKNGASLPGDAVHSLSWIAQSADVTTKVAWRLLACDLGADCGPDTPGVLLLCAIDGDCTAKSATDRIQGHQLPPAQYEQARAERDRLREALDRRDLAALGLARSTVESSPSSKAP